MSFTNKHHPSSTTLLLLILTPFLTVTLTYLAYNGNGFYLQSLFTAGFRKTSMNPSPTSHNTVLHILMGIITMPHLHERRQLIRSAYTLQRPVLSNVKIDVRFVLCGHEINEEVMMFLSLDITLYNDIILLDCVENMNEGKTYTYFSSLPSMLVSDRYDYVIKADDDTYFRLDNLANFLLNKPREDLYYGMELSCKGITESCGVNSTYMEGLGYVLSWDLVKWIAESDIARNDIIGVEDLMLGKWLNMGNKGKNRYNGSPDKIYDYKGELEDDFYRHDFVSDSVAIHKLKKNILWARTLKYFNVTHDFGF